MTNDLLFSSDRGCISLLVLLDLSAAFDTIEHNILLNRLEHFVGISGSTLAWFKSYLSDPHQFVAVNEEVSYRSQVQYAVPQGSVLGPLLFMLYMLPLGYIIKKHGVSFYCYCNDESEVCGSICRFTLIILIRVKQAMVKQQRQVYQRQNRD